MFKTMTQIGRDYNIDAKSVGTLLYKLNIRDSNHPVQKGFPFEQAITHGIAKEYPDRNGERYYRYDITSIKDEFETLVNTLPSAEAQTSVKQEASPNNTNNMSFSIEEKLKTMLTLLNTALATGDLEQLYRLKADIADIYALLPQKSA